MKIVSTIWRDERGQDLIEYALMAGFIAVASSAILPGVGPKLAHIYVKVSETFDLAGA